MTPILSYVGCALYADCLRCLSYRRERSNPPSLSFGRLSFGQMTDFQAAPL